MQKQWIFLFLFCFALGSAVAQDAEEKKQEEPVYGWENKFIGTLNLTQTSLSNWIMLLNCFQRWMNCVWSR